MGIFSRRPRPVSQRNYPNASRQLDLRTVGTWEWHDQLNQWHLSFNNQLGRIIRVRVDDFVLSLKEIKHGDTFPPVPTDGQRIDISGFYGFGDDYRWYASVHGPDGRRYFFQKFDAALARLTGGTPLKRSDEEVDLIPFEADGGVPDLPTHRPEARVGSPDQAGASKRPRISISDEDSAAVLSMIADYGAMEYDELASFLLGGALPWQEGVLKELKRRKDAGTLDEVALETELKKYRADVEQNRAESERRILAAAEAKFRKARDQGFDPPGGWGALGVE